MISVDLAASVKLRVPKYYSISLFSGDPVVQIYHLFVALWQTRFCAGTHFLARLLIMICEQLTSDRAQLEIWNIWASADLMTMLMICRLPCALRLETASRNLEHMALSDISTYHVSFWLLLGSSFWIGEGKDTKLFYH